MLTSGACDEGGAGRRQGRGRGSGTRWMAASVEVGLGAASEAALRSGGGAALNLGSGRRRGCGERAAADGRWRGESGESWIWGKWPRGEG